ncbi:MAG: hypothetical protein GTN70_06460 [Deltaproteobacteria bacterium]|nr:hypothetical protein [Deltaproteobacteria bacterium]NIS77324.1 hypothetical protein [Deltaproteobacteria bacterium]
MNRSGQIASLDRFLLRPEHGSGSWSYNIWDRKGDPLLFADCPAHPFFGYVRAVACIALGIGAFLGASMLIPESLPGPSGALLKFAAFLVPLLAAALALSQRYGTTIFLDGSMREVYLKIHQENRVPLPYTWYTVIDQTGHTIGRIRRSLYHMLILRRWHAYRPDGSLLCVANEDSVVRSVLGRIVGSRFAPMRSNYTLTEAKVGAVVGWFERRRLTFGCFVLDMSPDYKRTIDRRMALALGVMLDAGERP